MVGGALTQQPNITAVERLLECPLWLITVDKSLSTVRPARYTRLECLSYNRKFTRSMVAGAS